MIVIVEKNANGKIELTQEELQEMLEKVRQDGIEDYKKNQYSLTNTHPYWVYYNGADSGSLRPKTFETITIDCVGKTE